MDHDRSGSDDDANAPEWWNWPLELSPHVLKRMVDRGFSEIDLRLMLDEATELRPAREDGRWIAATTHDARAWEVVLEPDPITQVVVVVTAYALT